MIIRYRQKTLDVFVLADGSIRTREGARALFRVGAKTPVVVVQATSGELRALRGYGYLQLTLDDLREAGSGLRAGIPGAAETLGALGGAASIGHVASRSAYKAGARAKEAGRVGGAAGSGAAKRRGDSAYYRALRKKRLT